MRGLLAFFVAGSLALVAGGASAQLPMGEFAIGGFSLGATPGGVVFVNAGSNASTAVGGALDPDVNALAYDPISGDLFVGGIFGGDGKIRRLALNGTTAVAETLFVDLGTGASVKDIELDFDGDLVTSSTADVLRVDRFTAAFAVANSAPFPGTVNSVAASDALYAAVFATSGGPSTIHRIYDDGSSETIATTLGVVSGNAILSGLALGPGERELWACGFGVPSIVRLDVENAGIVVPLQGVSAVPVGLSDIDYDPVAGLFYAVTSGAIPHTAWAIDPTGPAPTATQVTSFPPAPFGVPAGITVHNDPDRLFVFPSAIETGVSASAPAQIALHGSAGHVGVVAITAVNGAFFLQLVGIGVFAADGRFALPTLTVPADPTMDGATIRFGFGRIAPGGGLAAANLYAGALAFDAAAGRGRTLAGAVSCTQAIKVPAGKRIRVRNDGPDAVKLQLWQAGTGFADIPGLVVPEAVQMSWPAGAPLAQPEWVRVCAVSAASPGATFHNFVE